METVKTNSFCKRQTRESRFSHFEGTWDQLEDLATTLLAQGAHQPGYRDGVILVRVPCGTCGAFRAQAVARLEAGDRVAAEYWPRREGEAPRLALSIKSDALPVDRRVEKVTASGVDLVLYRRDVLGDDATTDATWEIVSINAVPLEGSRPMDLMTLLHNHFGSDGGTDTKMSPAKFESALRESFEFWKDRAVVVD
jgi:hypothetical protein